ncbi:MAG: ROK family protein, partial [Elusimicrobiota bacterium]
MRLYFGIDVGGTKLSAALVTGKGRILSRAKVSTPRSGGSRAVLEAVEGLVRRVAAEGKVRVKDAHAAGAGLPGIIDARRGLVLNAPNIPLTGVPVAGKLKELLDIPVAVGNDVNLGLLGEQWLGAGRGARDAVGLFPGTGVGGGVIAGGKLLLGAHGAAAELGHIQVEPLGPPCGCGNKGCLEALSSRSSIERELRREIRAGKRSLLSSFADEKLAVIKSKMIAKALARRDPLTLRVVRAAAERLGSACVSLRHVFDPELFILGGGLIEACGGRILPIVQRALDSDPFFRKLP